MEIEMTDIVRGEKAADNSILAVTLNKEYTVLDSNRHNLPNRKGSHLKSTSIGNVSLLPQQLRDRSKKSKAESDAKILEYIAEENISDNQLFREIQSLENCCRKGITAAKTNGDCINCIMRHFINDDTKKTLQFNELCSFIRRLLISVYWCMIIS